MLLLQILYLPEVLGVPPSLYNVDLNVNFDFAKITIATGDPSLYNAPSRFVNVIHFGAQNFGYHTQIAFSYSNGVDVNKKWFRNYDAGWSSWVEF